MKLRKAITVVLGAVLMLSITACQNAAENLTAQVGNLDNATALASVQEPSDLPINTAAEVKLSELAKRMGAPLHYKDEFKSPKGNLSVSIDADVYVPESDSIKVLGVEKSDFTQDTANKLMSALLHGQLYECIEDGIFNTKTDLQAWIKAYGGKGDPSLQFLYEAAPAEKTLISGEFESPSYANALGEWNVSQDISEIRGMAQSDVGYEVFVVRNVPGGLYNHVVYQKEPNPGINVNGIGEYYTPDEITAAESGVAKGHVPFTSEQTKSVKDIAITKDEALAKGDDLVKKIGADSFTCCSAEKVYGGCYDTITNSFGAGNPLRCVWRLRYARTVNGIQATYTDEDCNSVRDEDADPNDDCKSNGLNDPWSYEEMTICIDDSGITDFYWKSPYKVTGTSVENANVISFENAMNVFETMMPVKNLYFASGNNGTIEVTGIRFGLARITEETTRDRGILVPVWDFFGTITYDQGKGNTQIDSRPAHSLLTINAIDGSVIDRSFGF